MDEGGRVNRKIVKGEAFLVDNSFVLPYNPTPSLRHAAHINVEVVYSVSAVKYLYKYVTKGHDRVMMGVQDVNDEITNFVNARYVSASEAFWRLYGFEIHRKYPPVEKLPCHLENQQTIVFEPDQLQRIQVDEPVDTKLTAFF